MPIFPILLNRRGMALLNLVILFILLGVLVSAGALILGPSISRGKTNDTKVTLERAASMITSWGARNGRLPDAGEYPAIFGATPLDAWGRVIVYAYDGAMSQTAGGGLCGRSSTAISSNGMDVAFFLASGGENAGVGPAPTTSGAFSGTLAGFADGDIWRVVTRNELQAQAGCAGSASGSLRIVNNELPGACKGRSYSAAIYGDGGVPPLSYSLSGLPAGITLSDTLLSGTVTAAQGTYQVVVTVTDSQQPTANAVQRSYILNVISSCR